MTPVARRITRVVALVGVIAAVYFGNVAVQSHLGRRTLAGTGLDALPLDAAKAQATAGDRAVFVDVSAIWCPSCRSFDARVLSDARVAAFIRERMVFARLEYESEEGKAFLREQGATGFPNLWVLDAEGRVVRKLVLTMEPEEFLAQLEAAVSGS